jgi:hypothetical protein
VIRETRNLTSALLFKTKSLHKRTVALRELKQQLEATNCAYITVTEFCIRLTEQNDRNRRLIRLLKGKLGLKVGKKHTPTKPPLKLKQEQPTTSSGGPTTSTGGPTTFQGTSSRGFKFPTKIPRKFSRTYQIPPTPHYCVDSDGD